VLITAGESIKRAHPPTIGSPGIFNSGASIGRVQLAPASTTFPAQYLRDQPRRNCNFAQNFFWKEMKFDFEKIEEEVKGFWEREKVYRVENDPSRPKYYVLDMFPYPSGAGLHVGHPLGYIASDIVARFKRLNGYNVLHPMGYDSFGLPAEQYAIQTGQHPKITTEKNIDTFRAQMDKLGFSYDWSREVKTSDPEFYHWTQWIFIQLFHSWYNKKTGKAEPIEVLIQHLAENGNAGVEAATDDHESFTAQQWNEEFSAREKSDVLLKYRLAYLADSWVNWCPALGTVLANDEVKDGVSERGGYPVERKLMKQWSLRITAYAERLLQGLEKIDWSDSLKESQRNWIGKSEGCSIRFKTELTDSAIEVFTTRPDTIFGVSFITLAPEHELVESITTPEYKTAVEEYITYAKNRSERDRLADVKKVTGQFTGALAIHPFTQEKIPIWIGEYVLATYGTGAVMGVPGHDERDHRFASHFGLRIPSILKGVDVAEKSFDKKEGLLANSGFLNGLEVDAAIGKAMDEIEKRKIGQRKINYKMRDAVFGRQRYWGEPIPVYYDEEGIPHTVMEKDLPLRLPEVDKYLPTESGEPPLARAREWKYMGKFEIEQTTMPGWAGSSWYYLRYGDPHNEHEFASQQSIHYWQNIDLYVGGDEHATGHLLYFRFWTKFLFDLGYIPFDEPAKKLVNQGKIQGVSAFVHSAVALFSVSHERNISINNTHVHPIISLGVVNGIINGNEQVTKRVEEVIAKKICQLNSGLSRSEFTVKLRPGEDFIPQQVPIEFVDENNSLDRNSYVEWRKIWAGEVNIVFIDEPDGRIVCLRTPEKMSKSKYNVIRPDTYYNEILKTDVPGVINSYGADCFRLYEMFLGPIEQHKPWDTKGIEGCFRFLKKFWRLFFGENNQWAVADNVPTREELKILHRTLKKASEDVLTLSFNTSVSAFMISVNELTQLNCRKRKILEPLLIALSPFAPFTCEKLWLLLGHQKSIVCASYPGIDDTLLLEAAFEYPVAVNGKTRAKMNFDLNLPADQIEKEVIAAEQLQKYFEGKRPKKVIVVKGRMINVVL
jgi:leucyl-tRNA synthetase